MNEEQLKSNFADHVATQPDPKTINWRNKSGSSDYFIRFRVDGQHLIVTGDCGSAIYRWSQDVTMEWVAGCDNSYILGKCEASSQGRRFYQWDQRACVERAIEQFKSYMGRKANADERALMIEHSATKEDWGLWIHVADAGGIFGNGRDFDGFSTLGEIPSIEFEYQMAGLRMAVAQIKASS